MADYFCLMLGLVCAGLDGGDRGDQLLARLEHTPRLQRIALVALLGSETVPKM
jgi:hypothetical protein